MFESPTLASPVFTAGRTSLSGVSGRAEYGWHRVSAICLALQGLLLGSSLVLYQATDLDVRWSSDVALLVLIGALAALWTALLVIPGDSTARRRLADGAAATVLFLSLIQITAPMQYGAIALGRPFIDAWLDTVDRWLGVDVPGVTAWTAQYSWLVAVLNVTYNSLVPQLLLPLVVLPMTGDRDGLWEYLWHLHVSLIGALICLALWPAVTPWVYYQYDPLVAPALAQHVKVQILALHAGTFHSLTLQDMQGLISFPSFHTAAAVVVTWSLRRQRRWLWMPVALVNIALISATVLLGLHYVTDLLGTVVLLAVSLAMYRRWLSAREGSGLTPVTSRPMTHH
jgi:membrane-associated phospholipid phosphatase